MSAFNMTCEAVEVTLPDYLDETLEAWVRPSVQAHLSECMRCSALVRDLRNIEREAAALPDLAPARDLWAGIAERIGTPVVALEPTRVVPPEPVVGPEPIVARHAETPIPGVYALPVRRRRFAPVWIGAAAAALIVLTAGTTYLLTARAVGNDGVPAIASVVPLRVAPLPEDAGVDSGIAAPGSESEPARATRARVGSPARGSGVTSVSQSTPAQIVYEREIDMLQTIMLWRKNQLDPATAATIEKNLKIIDAAIAESKAALRKDPASSMLSDQLSHTLDKKVELLRTAAMLPTRT